MELARRLQLENDLLRRHFSGFHIQDLQGGPNLGVVGTLTTNSGRRYSLWIPLRGFPGQAPRMYVVSPFLYDHKRNPLWEQGVRSDMHLLTANEHHHVQICHYQDSHWSIDVTLYKVVMKGRIWLEAYESHLRTGNTIDYYLGHM